MESYRLNPLSSLKMCILYISIVATFLTISCTPINAQRNIDFYEPDFTKEYALHQFTYDGFGIDAIFDPYPSKRGTINRDLPFPYHYSQFFSDYAKEKRLKKIIKKKKTYKGRNREEEIYEFDEDGYLVHSTSTIANGSNIEKKSKFYSYYDNRKSIKMVEVRRNNTTHTKIDTVSSIMFVYGNDKRLERMEVSFRKMNLDTISSYFRYNYSDNGLLKTITDQNENILSKLECDTISFESNNLWNNINDDYRDIKLYKVSGLVENLDSLINSPKNQDDQMYILKSGNDIKYIYKNDNRYFYNLKKTARASRFFNDDNYGYYYLNIKYMEFDTINSPINMLSYLYYFKPESYSQNSTRYEILDYNTTSSDLVKHFLYYQYSAFFGNKGPDYPLKKTRVRTKERNGIMVMKNYDI